MTNSQNRIASTSELLKLASQARRLCQEVSRSERERYRLAGRLARNPKDLRALGDSLMQGVKDGDEFYLWLLDAPEGWILLQLAIANASDRLWDILWDENHPEAAGQAWEGQDFRLMSEWRQQTRAIIAECKQAFVLKTTADEYAAQVSASGANEKTAGALLDFMSDVIGEGVPPST